MYDEMEGKTVLCCANSYEQKYFFNDYFDRLPEEVKQELKIMCVLFTEEAGGIISLVYEEDGSLSFEEISCGLMIRKLQTEKRELLEALEMFYKVFVLGEEYD